MEHIDTKEQNPVGKGKKEYYDVDTKKVKRNIIVLILFLAILGVSSLVYYIYLRSTRDVLGFLKIVSTYEQNEDEFIKQWPYIIQKAHTPVHYLILLKRLDQIGEITLYRDTLVKAIYKYPQIHSLLALAVDYYLNYDDGKVFEKFFNDIDELWIDYPNMARAYFVRAYEEKNLKVEGHDMLDIYYNIKQGNYTWNSLDLLWKITQEPMFLYLSVVLAKSTHNEIIAAEQYKKLPIEWKSSNKEYAVELAWVLRDTDFLLPVVESNKILDEYIRLASYLVLENRVVKAFEVLSDAFEFIPDECIYNEEFLSLYLWLILYKVNRSDIMIQLIARMPQVNDVRIQTKFMLYLYQFDQNIYMTYLEGIRTRLDLESDPLFVFFRMNTINTTIEQKKVYIWQIVNSEQYANGELDKEFWFKLAAVFFLSNSLLEDFLILYNNNDAGNLLYADPFYVYYKLNFIDRDLDNIDTFDFISDLENENYDWWQYYNIGLWKLNNKDYELAERYLRKALQVVENEFVPRYKQYPLVQLIRVNLDQDNLDEAELLFEELKIFFPTNPTIFNLEGSINQRKNEIVEEKGM